MPQKRDHSNETGERTVSSSSSDSTEGGRTADRNGRLPIGRRGCLRLVGGAVASAVALGGAGTAAAQQVNASDISGGTYDVDGSVKILVGQNEYGDYGDLEDVLINAEGEDLQISTFGDDWTIRNVGVSGAVAETNTTISLDSDGGTGLVENVYLGDGSTGNRVGFFVKREHSGTITIRNCHVADFTDNGIYGSPPGQSDGGGGTVQIENCYAENCNRSGFRIGGDGSYIRDSVVVVDDDLRETEGGALTARGVWARYDDVEIENTDISIGDRGATSAVWATNGATAEYSDSDYSTAYDFGDFEGDVETTDVGNDPDTSVPSGVPTSAEEAAGGGASGSSDVSSDESDDDSDTEESSDGADGEDTTESADSDESTEEETADESTEEESADESDETDTSEGEASNEANEETSGDAEDDDLPNDVTVRSENGDDVRYEFTVEGDLEAQSSGDEVSGSTAEGVLLSESSEDAYEFSGEFSEFRYSGPVEIDVNGRTVYQDSDS